MTATHTELTEDQLLQAYRTMSEIRHFEDRLHQENLTGDIPGFIHLYAGEEAIATGVCSHLTPADMIASTHRGHGHCIAKGCDIKGMMLEIFGREEGLCHGKGGSMHIADLSQGMLGANGIVGGGPPLAIGAALTAKLKGNGDIAVSFTGDGGSNQGLVFEAMNMAVVLNLPVVFVFENNGIGEATGVDYSIGSKDIMSRAAGFGMPAITCDGTDFFDVWEAAKGAVDRAREGGGPTVIEAVATRYYGHFEGDQNLYRTPEQIKAAQKDSDPLKKFRQSVGDQMGVSALDEIDEQAEKLVDESVKEAREAPAPDPKNVDTDVYVSY